MFNFFKKPKPVVLDISPEDVLQKLKSYLLSEIARFPQCPKRKSYEGHLVRVEKKLQCSSLSGDDTGIELYLVRSTAYYEYRKRGFRSFFGLKPQSGKNFNEMFGDIAPIIKQLEKLDDDKQKIIPRS